ncbi:MAG: phosphotransferase [Deltaproteobacteria bacterium]|nr:phosphotransferase [Deltaproteobacteria bacterium]
MLSWGDEAVVRRDPELRGLGLLLDPEVLAALIAIQMPELGVRSLRIDYLRYKPGTRCLAGVILETDARGPVRAHAVVHGADAAEKLRKTAQEANWAGPTSSLATIADAGLAVCVFPFDRKLPALRHIVDVEAAADKFARLLGVESPVTSLETLAYKPERRFVAAAKDHDKPLAALKLFVRGADLAAVRLARAVRSGERLLVPRLLGHKQRWNLLALEWLEGESLRDALGKSHCLASIHQTGAALAELHALPSGSLPDPGPRHGADGLLAAAAQVSWLLPSVQGHVENLAARLMARLAESPQDVFAHGDFYDKQVVLQRDRAGILDLDAAHRGDAAQDLGLFLAHLEAARLAGLRVLPDLVETEAALVEGYASVREPPSAGRIRLHRAAGLLTLAPHPFRSRNENWWDGVERVIEAACSAVEPARRRSRRRLADPCGVEGDPAFPSMACLLDPDEMTRRFRRLLPATGFERVDKIRVRRHKPGRRAVIEYRLQMVAGLRLQVLAKVRAKGADLKGHEIAERLWQAMCELPEPLLRIPRPIGVERDLHAAFQRVEEGNPITRELGRSLLLALPANQHVLGKRIVLALNEFQSLPCPAARVHGVEDELRILERSLGGLARTRGEWAARIRRLEEAARRAASRLGPAALVTTHRDLHPDQILDDGTRLTFVDLDLVARADPALDAGNLAAHATELALRCGHPADALSAFEEALTQAGDVRIWAALALARLTAISARMPERGHATETLLQEAEKRLGELE